MKYSLRILDEPKNSTVTLSRGGDVQGVSARRGGAHRNLREAYYERASLHG